MINWIRVATNIGDDDRLDELAEHLNVRVAEAVGLVVLVLCKLPAIAPDGNIGAFRDARLDKWAGWHGKAGVFGAAFRRVMCEDDHVRAWEKHNGKALAKAERNADRARQWRETKAAEKELLADQKLAAARDKVRLDTQTNALPNAFANAFGMHTERPPSHMNVTRRNVTRRTALKNNNSALRADDAPASPLVDGPVLDPQPPPSRRSSPAPQWPAFTQEHCQRLHQRWKERLGGVNFGRFRKAFGDVYGTPEADRSTGAPLNAELDDAFEHWLLSVTRGPSAPFATPESCAARLSAVAHAARGFGDDFIAQFKAVDVVVHGRPLPKSA